MSLLSLQLPDALPDRLSRYLRLGWIVVALLPAILLGVPAQWLAMRLHRGVQRRLPQWFHRYVLRVFGVRVRIVGEPCHDRPVLIVANHLSWLDISVIGSLMPLSFIAKSEVASWPLFGLFSRLQRSVYVDRASKRGTKAVNGVIAERLAEGDPIVLFCEGTTSDGNRTLPFRSALLGAAHDAIVASGAPSVVIQPLAIHYVRRHGLPVVRTDRPALAWYGDMDLAPHMAVTLCQGPIDVQLNWGTPLSYEKESDRKEVARSAERELRRLGALARTGRDPQA